MIKTYTEQWRDGTLPVGSYYIKLLGDVERIDFFEGLEWERTKDFGIEEVLGPVPDYMYCKGLIYDSIALNENRKKVDELKKRLEVSEKEHYRTLEQLRIATAALKKFKERERDYLDYGIDKDGNKIYLYPNRVATKALKEMEGVK